MANINEVLQEQGSAFDAPVDTETENLTLDQIRTLALKEAAGEKPTAAKTRGAAQEAEPEAEEEEGEEEEPETIYRKVIDLGDGSGTQVFEGATPDEVMDKLAQAQVHATRKIREQAAELKKLQEKPAAKEPTQDDKDDEFLLSQEMLRNPTTAVKKAFKKATGLDIDEIKTLAERVKTIDATETARGEEARQQAAASKFLSDHPEYVPNPTNGARLNRAVDLLIREARANGQEVNYETLLTSAYADLTASGLLKLKSEDADENVDGDTKTTTRRIDATSGQGSQKQTVRSGSSLTSRSKNTTRQTKTLSEDDLYSMPLDKLKQLAQQAK